MKFIIEYGAFVEQRLLMYIPEECSFDMKPIIHELDLELILNKITLSVVDERIVQVWGFCGLNESIKSDCKVPDYKRGSLKVEHNLNPGFAYGINDNEDYPIYVNVRTGWVCIGDPERKNNAVEFINNCVAVIDDDNQFVSLWLKPEGLPDV